MQPLVPLSGGHNFDHRTFRCPCGQTVHLIPLLEAVTERIEKLEKTCALFLVHSHGQ